MPISRPVLEKVMATQQAYSSLRPYVILFLGASASRRRWSPGNFSVLADFIRRNSGLTVVLAGGEQDTASAAAIIHNTGSERIVDLTAKTSLVELAQMAADAEFFVSNETGFVHIAVAAGAKGICLSNGNHYGRFNPYPLHVYERIDYIYPDRLSQMNIERCRQQRSFVSCLDVNDVPTNKAIEILRKYLKAC